MLRVTLKNKYICYCIEGIYGSLDPRFATHLWQLLSANGDDEFVQTVEIPKQELVKIYASTSARAEGIGAVINKEINDILLPQLMAAGHLSEAELELIQEGLALQPPATMATDDNGTPDPYIEKMKSVNALLDSNEAAYVLFHIGRNNAANLAEKNNIIQRGRQAILKPYA